MINYKNDGKEVRFLVFSLLFITLFTSQVSFSQSLADTKVTITVNNTAFKEIFSTIEKQTNYSFAYDESIGNQKISLQVENKPLQKVLSNISKEKGLLFKSIGNNISVRRKKDTQKVQIKGVIIDKNDQQPLPGASVLEKGTRNGTTSDFEGNFFLKLSKDKSTLVISFIGYNTKEINVSTETSSLTIELEPEQSQLEEIVVVGYASKKKKEITGAISTITNASITQAPVGNITTTLAGRASGLSSIQSSGQPGFDNANLRIRDFGNPLVIIDGVEGDFSTLDPNTVESFSVLKDASASIYGARAGNGVILITTRRGNNSKPKITINSAYTLQGITMMPKPVNAGQYAELRREAHLNEGNDVNNAPFTEEQIQKFYNGTDPQFPNTNWYDAIFRDNAPQLNQNISVRGGSENLKYYAFLGYLNQETMVKKGNSGYTRYNLISNADLKINNNFQFQVNLSNILDNKKYPSRGLGANNSRAWKDYWNTVPTYPSSLPDPEKLSYAEGSNTGGAHITSNRDIAGYRDTEKDNFNGLVNLKYKNNTGIFGNILFSYNKVYTTIKRFEKPVKFYTYSYETDTYNLEGALGNKASLVIEEKKYRRLNGQLSLGYDTYIKNHHIKLLSLFEITDYYNNYLQAGRSNFISDAIEDLYGGSTQNMTNKGFSNFSARESFVNRLSYDYSKKYFIDVTLRADASSKFPKSGRWGYFPSISFAWRASEESFLNNYGNLDELKLRLSYGEAGNDDLEAGNDDLKDLKLILSYGDLLYESGYKISDNIKDGISYLIGDDSYTGVLSLGLANPNLTWERTNIYNAGIDFSFYNRKIYGEIDAFYRVRNGIIGSRKRSIPSTVGATLPPENINSISNRGFELTVGTSGNHNEFNWDVSANLSWSRAKWMYFEEPNYEDEDQRRINKKTGEWVDRIFGYKSDGLFTSQQEIDNLGFNQDGSTTPNSSLKPGDVKYIDINNDGKLDWRDQIDLGSTTPHWLFGLNFNGNYKSFDFSVLFQGAFAYNTWLSLRNGSVYTETYYNERWTEENNRADAIVPRIGGRGIAKSDFNIKEASYIRLKSATLGFTLPKVPSFDSVRLFLAGTNLFTVSKLNKYDIDPETANEKSGRNYPQQKTFSMGVNLSF